MGRVGGTAANRNIDPVHMVPAERESERERYNNRHGGQNRSFVFKINENFHSIVES